MAEIYLENVSKVFGKGTVAVKNLTLKIEDKEVIAILGPSGCGKTTTLRIIAGLEKPTSGRIYIGGKDVTDLPPKDRNIGMVFQFYAIYPGKTVYENIAFPLRCRGLSKSEIRREVMNIADYLEITRILDKEAVACHPSEKQLTALARALVTHPQALLLDEPLTVLDADTRELMRVKLKQIIEKEGITCIYVTHDQKEGMSLGHRIAVMKDGELQQVDTPSRLLNNPINKFVAGFIGSPTMNFLNGEIIKKNNEYYVIFSFGSVKIGKMLEKCEHKISLGDEITIGIRPRDIVLYTKEVENSVPGYVSGIEYFGDHMLIKISLSSGDSVICQTTPIKLKINDFVSVILPEEKYFFFDKDGKNILFKEVEKNMHIMGE